MMPINDIFLKKLLAVILVLPALCSGAAAQDVFEADRGRWLTVAEQCKPGLNVTRVAPVAIVGAVQDPAAFQGWRFEKQADPDVLGDTNFRQTRSVTLDFGRHVTGYLGFRLKTLGDIMDCPVRLKFMFGETPGEMNEPLDPWKGSLSRAWMQDEVLTIDIADRDIHLERRMAFRFLRIELAGGNFDFALDGVHCQAVSSAGELEVAPLGDDCPQIIKDINRVSIATLAECMQTVYEDGPKRDRRLWIGDLYLESLANRYSFKNNLLTKRCLYLFAGLANERGLLMADLFEHPEPHPQYGTFCLTYSLLYPSVLLEYLNDTGDMESALDLWPVARLQVEEALRRVRSDYTCDASRAWLFFDHAVMDLEVPFQGAMLFALNQCIELGEKIGRGDDVKEWKALASKISKGARARYFDRKSGVMRGTSGEISVHAQVWAVIGGILNAKQGRKALSTALACKDAIHPASPYAMHYLVDAMLRCGMFAQARSTLVDYWGGMVLKGADTFWEVYEPGNDFRSPYSFYPLNSYCHAWSCTPTYFIYSYPEVFQK